MSEHVEVIYPDFFDKNFLSLAHWMVYQRYSTYNNVLKYFISFDIPQLLSRESKAKWWNKKINYKEFDIDLLEDKQNLIIIPDNRSRKNQLSDKFFNENINHLYSTDTQVRKDTNRWQAKKSKNWIIIATQSEVFQPYHNLWKIFYIDWFKWYYHNQQDPRYDITEVVNKMQKLWGCDVININNIWLIK